MIRVPFDRDALAPEVREEWDDWQRRAEAARDAVVEAHREGRPITLRAEIWAELKLFLFKHVFNGKCAYCESKVTITSFGDAEHWRPKGGVSACAADSDTPAPVVDDRGEPHPGYFWLAYDWRNLVPACQECNSGSKGNRGKGTQFPVEGRHVFSPDEGPDVETLDRIERPLLLHPFDEEANPERHFRFDEFGQAVPLTDRGLHSVRVFNLHRTELSEEHRHLYETLYETVKDALAKQLNGGPPAKQTLRAIMYDSRRPHLHAKRYYIRKWYPLVLDELSEIP